MMNKDTLLFVCGRCSLSFEAHQHLQLHQKSCVGKEDDDKCQSSSTFGLSLLSSAAAHHVASQSDTKYVRSESKSHQSNTNKSVSMSHTSSDQNNGLGYLRKNWDTKENGFRKWRLLHNTAEGATSLRVSKSLRSNPDLMLTNANINSLQKHPKQAVSKVLVPTCALSIKDSMYSKFSLKPAFRSRKLRPPPAKSTAIPIPVMDHVDVRRKEIGDKDSSKYVLKKFYACKGKPALVNCVVSESYQHPRVGMFPACDDPSLHDFSVPVQQSIVSGSSSLAQVPRNVAMVPGGRETTAESRMLNRNQGVSSAGQEEWYQSWKPDVLRRYSSGNEVIIAPTTSVVSADSHVDAGVTQKHITKDTFQLPAFMILPLKKDELSQANGSRNIAPSLSPRTRGLVPYQNTGLENSAWKTPSLSNIYERQQGGYSFGQNISSSTHIPENAASLIDTTRSILPPLSAPQKSVAVIQTSQNTIMSASSSQSKGLTGISPTSGSPPVRPNVIANGNLNHAPNRSAFVEMQIKPKSSDRIAISKHTTLYGGNTKEHVTKHQKNVHQYQDMSHSFPLFDRDTKEHGDNMERFTSFNVSTFSDQSSFPGSSGLNLEQLYSLQEERIQKDSKHVYYKDNYFSAGNRENFLPESESGYKKRDIYFEDGDSTSYDTPWNEEYVIPDPSRCSKTLYLGSEYEGLVNMLNQMDASVCSPPSLLILAEQAVAIHPQMRTAVFGKSVLPKSGSPIEHMLFDTSDKGDVRDCNNPVSTRILLMDASCERENELREVSKATTGQGSPSFKLDDNRGLEQYDKSCQTSPCNLKVTDNFKTKLGESTNGNLTKQSVCVGLQTDLVNDNHASVHESSHCNCSENIFQFIAKTGVCNHSKRKLTKELYYCEKCCLLSDGDQSLDEVKPLTIKMFRTSSNCSTEREERVASPKVVLHDESFLPLEDDDRHALSGGRVSLSPCEPQRCQTIENGVELSCDARAKESDTPLLYCRRCCLIYESVEEYERHVNTHQNSNLRSDNTPKTSSSTRQDNLDTHPKPRRRLSCSVDTERNRNTFVNTDNKDGQGQAEMLSGKGCCISDCHLDSSLALLRNQCSRIQKGDSDGSLGHKCEASHRSAFVSCHRPRHIPQINCDHKSQTECRIGTPQDSMDASCRSRQTESIDFCQPPLKHSPKLQLNHCKNYLHFCSPKVPSMCNCVKGEAYSCCSQPLPSTKLCSSQSDTVSHEDLNCQGGRTSASGKKRSLSLNEPTLGCKQARLVFRQGIPSQCRSPSHEVQGVPDTENNFKMTRLPCEGIARCVDSHDNSSCLSRCKVAQSKHPKVQAREGKGYSTTDDVAKCFISEQKETGDLVADQKAQSCSSSDNELRTTTEVDTDDAGHSLLKLFSFVKRNHVPSENFWRCASCQVLFTDRSEYIDHIARACHGREHQDDATLVGVVPKTSSDQDSPEYSKPIVVQCQDDNLILSSGRTGTSGHDNRSQEMDKCARIEPFVRCKNCFVMFTNYKEFELHDCKDCKQNGKEGYK